MGSSLDPVPSGVLSFAPMEPTPDDFGPAQRVLFIDRLSRTGDVKEALDNVSVSPLAALRAYKDDPAFKAQWDEAMEAATLLLEAHAIKRGTKGHERKTLDNAGNLVTVESPPSDKLLIAALKARKPDMYSDKVRVTGADGGPLEVRDRLIESILLMSQGVPNAEAKVGGKADKGTVD